MVAIPRFALKPFQLISTPGRLQSALDDEYGSMVFEPVEEAPVVDREYGEKVVQAISAQAGRRPEISYSPASSDLMELAYSELTPLVSEWVGFEVERSWGYGIRSYGPGSRLHVHRDRVDTHVISCIIHVDDRSVEAWPLDFVDHEGKHHEVYFKRGQTLFYESLCPHARSQFFNGEYYRNMYLHWRPVGWDSSPYQGLRCKFASLEEAKADCVALAQAERALTIPPDWQQWLALNQERGCDREGMIRLAVQDGGLAVPAIEAFLDELLEDGAPHFRSAGQQFQEIPPVQAHAGLRHSSVAVPSWLQWFEAPITRAAHMPRAWKLDTQLAQVYELPDLLSPEDCQLVVDAINNQLVPSSVTRGESTYRTSRTCHLVDSDAELSARIDRLLADLMGVDPRLSEPLQGQRYQPGQYFKEHTDWFDPGTSEFQEHASVGGQRTWTVMIYLNTVPRGGQTCFKLLNRCYSPVQGFALAWNNLMADGSPNPYTLHEAMPVEEGEKWVITKWFRAGVGRNG
jgi:prolyl 4-hydroxylase